MKLRVFDEASVRGHSIVFDEDSKEWLYADTLELVGDCNGRPCTRCGKLPTVEGHDACLGTLSGGVSAACCGHGVKPPYVMFEDGLDIRGDEALEFIRKQKKRMTLNDQLAELRWELDRLGQAYKRALRWPWFRKRLVFVLDWLAKRLGRMK